MVKSDTTTPENGLIQRCEDNCGLGRGGITGNTDLYTKFVGWLNQWNKTGMSIAIMAWNGADPDDKGYTTKPSGTMAGTINRDYNYDSSYKVLKLKLVQVSYDGTNYVTATPFDASDKARLATKDPNIDGRFSTSYPKFDERGDGFDIYPKFTQAQVDAGAKIYLEWFRAGRDFDTTSGTDTYEPGIDLQFHHFPAVGASWEYCKLYKPDLAEDLRTDLFGNNANIPGLKKDIEAWYNAKNRLKANIGVSRRVKR